LFVSNVRDGTLGQVGNNIGGGASSSPCKIVGGGLVGLSVECLERFGKEWERVDEDFWGELANVWGDLAMG
jgi:hypothetical protein